MAVTNVAETLSSTSFSAGHNPTGHGWHRVCYLEIGSVVDPSLTRNYPLYDFPDITMALWRHTTTHLFKVRISELEQFLTNKTFLYIYTITFFLFLGPSTFRLGYLGLKNIFIVTSNYKSFEQLYMFSSNLCYIGFIL
jgi:hypothetical protein